MMEAKRHIEPHRPVFALTGCKLDLVSNGARREVSKDEAKAFAEQNGLFFVETSARTGVNVEEVFNMVTQEVSVSAFQRDNKTILTFSTASF